jgi:hypothetical protein
MQAVIIEGVQIFTEEAENYLQINDIAEPDLARIWKPLCGQYPRYEVNLCFRDMPAPAETLAAIGATVLEDCVRYAVTPEQLRSAESFPLSPPGSTVSRLAREDFPAFAQLHDRLNETLGLWWTSRRIWEQLDIWRIYIIKNADKITGYAMLMCVAREDADGEIFTVEADTHGNRCALFSAAARCAFDEGKKRVIFMVERGSDAERDVALAVGCGEDGVYVGYEVKICDMNEGVE